MNPKVLTALTVSAFLELESSLPWFHCPEYWLSLRAVACARTTTFESQASAELHYLAFSPISFMFSTWITVLTHLPGSLPRSSDTAFSLTETTDAVTETKLISINNTERYLEIPG